MQKLQNIAILKEKIHLSEDTMEQKDIDLLIRWFEQNKDHKLNFLEKQAVKLAVSKAETVGELMETALSFLKSGK